MAKRASRSKPGKGPVAPPLPEQEAAAASDESGKNPAAVQLGRLGGLKGGPARARKLSRQQRTAIARKAAQARWAKHRQP